MVAPSIWAAPEVAPSHADWLKALSSTFPVSVTRPILNSSAGSSSSALLLLLLADSLLLLLEESLSLPQAAVKSPKTINRARKRRHIEVIFPSLLLGFHPLPRRQPTQTLVLFSIFPKTKSYFLQVGVLTNPRVHGNTGSNSSIYRSCRTKLSD